ncbi:hypothetical protein [Myroides sp. TSA_177.3]|uniref:hypothetical protein n=1 Tax=Myroides sp. TSA_177.3 TaxID=3415650 RepID=UPI0040465574
MIAGGGLSGGISSTIADGDFWQGMQQGLITSGLNHAMHMVVEGDKIKHALEDAALDPFTDFTKIPSEEWTKEFAEKVFPGLSKSSGNPNYSIKGQLEDDKGRPVNGKSHYTYYEKNGNFTITSKNAISLSKNIFLSYYTLASTIGHELVYMTHYFSGDYQTWANKYGREGARVISEIFAYDLNKGGFLYNAQEHTKYINMAKENKWSY